MSWASHADADAASGTYLLDWLVAQLFPWMDFEFAGRLLRDYLFDYGLNYFGVGLIE